MRTFVILSAFLPIALVSVSADEPKKDADWVALFDGKTLDGWTPKIKGYEFGDNHADTFRAEDGVIKVNYDKYKEFEGKFGHLFYKDKFSHYRLRVEYRFVGDQCKGGPGWATRNSGVMFHCQDPKSMRKDQDFPVSIEAQFLGGLGKGKRSTNNMCSPGTNIVLDGKLFTTHCTNSKSKTYDGDVWVTAEIEVNGSGTVKHFVEGELVMEYEKPQLDEKDADAAKLVKERDGKLLLEEGYIALQAESHPCEFRKVEVKVLKK
ncbi:MAG: DUF1080 domain-containing protein [Planctomycetaceae bacterium]|nr:DUF1080 domain-containing protein [Planctomycetaceae bacterium]